MIVKRNWNKKFFDKERGRYGRKHWTGIFLLGFIPLYIEQHTTIYGES